MALRRRERRTERSKLDATPPWDQRQRPDPEATTGPFDSRDHPDDGTARIDLGALQLPVLPDLEVRLDVDDQQRVVSVTVVGPEGHLQLGVFAAPRNEGIWDEVRTELATSIKDQKGVVEERADGEFGIELVGALPTEDAPPGQGVPVRFVGVDGPRWFLRGMFVGPVATSAGTPEHRATLETLMRQTVVVRGSEPLPVREPVPLQLPKEVAAAAAEAATESDATEAD